MEDVNSLIAPMFFDIIPRDTWIVLYRLTAVWGTPADRIMLYLTSQQIYFILAGQLQPDGTFWKTVPQMEKDTLLSYYQQQKTLEKIPETVLFREVRALKRQFATRRHFRVNLLPLTALICQKEETAIIQEIKLRPTSSTTPVIPLPHTGAPVQTSPQFDWKEWRRNELTPAIQWFSEHPDQPSLLQQLLLRASGGDQETRQDLTREWELSEWKSDDVISLMGPVLVKLHKTENVS
jgi:hypothetical protein